MESTENPVAKKLVAHFGDSRSEAARVMRKSTETIRLWLKDGIPMASAIEVETRSGGAVTAEEILADARRIAAADKAGSEARAS